MENGRIVRLPYNEARFLDKLDRTINKFMMKNQRQPSIGELSELLSETENRIRSAMKSDVRSLSIDAPFREDGERCLNDMLPASEESRADYQTEKESLTIELRSVLDKTLTPNERRVIARLFGLDGFPKSLVEIASETGFSSERIRQIRESSLNRLRNSKHSKMLRTYL